MIARSRLRGVLLLAVVVLLLAAVAGWWFLLRDNADPAANAARASFIETCKDQGRAANGGGQMRMDDATEDSLDRYCSCVADHFDQALSPAEIRAVGDGSASQEILAKLNRVVTTCQVEHLPIGTDQPAPAN